MRSDRVWMYCRLKDGLLNKEFMDGIDKFIDFACSHPYCMDGDKIKCPYNFRKCQNRSFYDVNTVRFHLLKYGFVSDYHDWILHGETNVMQHVNQNVHDLSQHYGVDNESSSNAYHAMVLDATGPNFNPDHMDESSNPTAKLLYDILNDANQQMWYGCQLLLGC